MKSVDETKVELIERVSNLSLNMIEWELLSNDDPASAAEKLIRDNYKDIHLDILKLYSLDEDETLRNAAQEALEKLSSPDKEYAVVQNNEQLKQMMDYLLDHGYQLLHEGQVLVVDSKTKTVELQPLQALLKSEEQSRNPNTLQAILQSPTCPLSLINRYLDHENLGLQNTAKAALEQRSLKEYTQFRHHDKNDRSLDERLNDAQKELANQSQERAVEKHQDLER